MATPLDPRLHSRRGLVKRTGVALAALWIGAGQARAAVAAARQRRPVYLFNPDWGAGRRGCPGTREATHRRGTHSCHACTACHRHATNKRFASRLKAEERRAHHGCRCRIDERYVSNREFRRMFGAPGSPDARLEYDFRWS